MFKISEKIKIIFVNMKKKKQFVIFYESNILIIFLINSKF